MTQITEVKIMGLLHPVMLEELGYTLTDRTKHISKDGKYTLTFQEDGQFAGSYELRDANYLIGYVFTYSRLQETISKYERR